MTSVKLTPSAARGILVLGLAATGKDLAIENSDSVLTAAQLKVLTASLTAMKAVATVDSTIKVPDAQFGIILFTGLGEKSKSYKHETLRRAAGAAARALVGEEAATFALPHSNTLELSAIAEGAALGAYTFHEFRGTSKNEHRPSLKSINVLTRQAKETSAKSVAARAEIIADRTALVRDFINTPPSHLTPESFSLRMKKIAAPLGLKVEILNETQLRDRGYGGITAVGQGSANPPRLLHITYSPAKAKKRYAFVGKGITFDTGGLALKPAAGMEAMKSDMSGAAAVMGALFAIADLKLPIAIDAWAPLAENMPSDSAVRPSDIITMYGGKTVEVLNPDAEGRLVLGDALVRALEMGKKAGGLDGIIDVATLTGAQVVALGTRTSAVMTNDEEFSGQFLTATNRSGEQFWPMPLPEELRASLDSPVADLANIGDRMGGMLVAGLFLREFVDPATPWLHLDIAGPSFNSGTAHGYTPVGGTGIALRSLVVLAELACA